MELRCVAIAIFAPTNIPTQLSALIWLDENSSYDAEGDPGTAYVQIACREKRGGKLLRARILSAY